MNHTAAKCFHAALIAGLLAISASAQAERLKDIAGIGGIRSNPLVGYGLVVGLDGTGEQTPYTAQAFKSMLSRFGIVLPDGQTPKFKNVAAVAIQAELPPYAKPGQPIDVTVSSLGEAKSLRGGALLMAPLRGVDGEIYAIAQGNLVVGGFGAQGNDGSKITINVPTSGRIPNGATVERISPNGFALGDSVMLNLHEPDFTTAKRVAEQINLLLGPLVAQAVDAGTIEVGAPRDPSQRVTFMSVLENLTLEPGEPAARVVINSRTGTIVIGNHVRVKKAAVAHGNLVVTITEQQNVSQPNALAQGNTVTTPQSNVAVNQDDSRMFLFPAGVTLEQIVRAVNAVGAAPGDLMAILEALKQAGALQAELVVI
ncbi:flagellar basal body P-ring protein FlgI [Permianibacter fluminis]|uniref:flagellar basal body P-ring protein FlgI n=1 Tax=Permianibacter fluminis TaxID=2738515 RepID=UPI001F161A54|nr:flagellar basal body P-ring protein FlgI [Permianibacter fluminis]